MRMQLYYVVKFYRSYGPSQLECELTMCARARSKHLMGLKKKKKKKKKEKEENNLQISKAPFSSRKFSTLSKIQNMKIFNVF